MPGFVDNIDYIMDGILMNAVGIFQEMFSCILIEYFIFLKQPISAVLKPDKFLRHATIIRKLP